MRKAWIILGGLTLLLCLGLTAACGGATLPALSSPSPAEGSPPPTVEPSPVPTPEPILLGGQSLSADTRELTLEAPDPETLEALCAAAERFTALETLRLEGITLTPAQVLALRESYPAAELRYTVALLGQDCPAELRELTVPDAEALRADEALLPRLSLLLPELRALSLPEGEAPEGEEAPLLFTLDELSALREALPEEIGLRCRFELFGQVLSSGDEEIYYDRAGLQAGDLDTVRKALPLLSACKRFVLDSCGPKYEELAALRDEFPDKNIVWRVHFKADSLLTDATVLWTTYIRDDNCRVLDYCTELEYIDLGHDEWLTDISFCAHMPKLKVLIIALTDVKDISALANCPELEYLEVFGTRVSDLSPLSNCKKLEHLNISTNAWLTDISPLYGLTSLKRLRMIKSPVPKTQKDEITQLLPDCEMMFTGEDPTGNGWRKDRYGRDVERYALLRQQIGYNGYDSPAKKIDWDHTWKPGYA